MADIVAANNDTSSYFQFHAEAHALSGKLNKPFEEQIKKQAFVKLEGKSQDLLIESKSENLLDIEEADKLRRKRAQENYLSQHAKNYRLESIISYSAAHTQVAGHRSKKDTDVFVTTATSSVENLNILNVVTADRVVAQISTTHRKGQYSPEVTFLGTHFENLRIARHQTEPYLRLDRCRRKLAKNEMRIGQDADFRTTVEAQYARLRTSLADVTVDERKKMRFRDDDSLIKTYHEGALDFAKLAGEAADAQKMDSDPKKGFSDWNGITCSLVEHVVIRNIIARGPDGEWVKIPPPVRIPPPGKSFGHVIHIPDFGTIFLAELRVNHNSYNLTMVRLELGCIADGDASVASCTVNGRGHP